MKQKAIATRRESSGADSGWGLLVGEIILGAVRDLSILHRKGLWTDDPREIPETLTEIGRKGLVKQPNNLLICQGSLIDLAISERGYLVSLCGLGRMFLGVNMTPGRLIAAAQRHSVESHHVRHGKPPRQLAF